MAYADRVKLYEEIERLRGRPLITYVTSHRENAGGVMASDVIPEFCKQLNEIPDAEENVDVFIVSMGGDPMVSWRVISLLRERFKKIGALLPYQAYSAATLLALGADEIVMHPYSNLGPVDPQILIVKEREGIHPPRPFGSEDLTHYINFVNQDVGITDQEQKERAFELICNEVGPLQIGIAKRSSNLALSLGRQLLSLHMKDQNKVNTIAESLNKSFYHHGYPVGRTEAKSIGLPVTKPPKELEQLMWDVWQDMEREMQCAQPFNPLEIVLSDPTLAPHIAPVQQIQLPANLPPEISQQVYQQILDQVKVSTLPSIDYEIFQATLESKRLWSKHTTTLKITAIRKPDLNINVNVAPILRGWKTIYDNETSDDT